MQYHDDRNARMSNKDRNARMSYRDRNARMSYQSSDFAMAEGTQMTHCADSLKQYEEVQTQDHQNQREELPESIKKLIAATKMMLSRSNKLRQGKQAAEEYEDQIPGAREIKDFQEPENLQKGRNKLSEERRTIEKLEVFGEKIQEEKTGQIKNDEFLEPSPKIKAIELKNVHPILEHDDGGLDLSKEIESRTFENPPLAFKDKNIIVPHQPFDEIPKPSQLKLLESEPISPSTQPLKIRKNDLVCRLSGKGSSSEEEKNSMGFSDVGLHSKSAKREKRKLGIDVHLGLEYTGDDGEGKGFLNFGFFIQAILKIEITAGIKS
jgi:hypothetical protein